MSQELKEEVNKLLLKIAKKHIPRVRKYGFEPQGLDSLDIFELGVWELEDLLRETFKAGTAFGALSHKHLTGGKNGK